MSIAEAERVKVSYALARTPLEYERLRAQSRVWEAATNRLLDEVALSAGASCLDAGCGPGETMRLMAERVGPSGRVTGVDVDAALGDTAVAMLRAHGHRQCQFARVDLTAQGSIPGEPFDLVYARLLLYHLPERVAVLRRLWEAVVPGGHLLVQDYDVRSIGVLPELESVEEFKRVALGAFSAAGCDVQVGARLPELFALAGVGAPDGTDVAGRLDRIADAHWLFTGVYRGVLSTAIAHGFTNERRAAAWLSGFAHDVESFPDRPALWPLLIGAWKRKPTDSGQSSRDDHASGRATRSRGFAPATVAADSEPMNWYRPFRRSARRTGRRGLARDLCRLIVGSRRGELSGRIRRRIRA